MQAYIREKLTDALVHCNGLVNQYQGKESGFYENTIQWFKGLEEDLSRLRHPIVSMISAERAKLLAAKEGRIPGRDSVSRYKTKAIQFQAVQGIDDVEKQIRITIDRIDSQFLGWKEKIAQLLALSSSVAPIEISAHPVSHTELKKIWHQLGRHKETQTMHRYLSAAMSEADLLFLLEDMISNFLSNHNPGFESESGD